MREGMPLTTGRNGGRRGFRRRRGGIGMVLLGLAAGATVLLVATPLGRYLARAAWEEGKILRGRKPIEQLVADASTDPQTRAKLELVLLARSFAEDSIGLPAKEAFTKFTQLDSDTLVLVLSGTRKDALVPKMWWFPVVGRLPYKGYFKTSDALRAEVNLARDGYDTYLRPAAAFSTLGWFNDPLLSTTLRADSVDLVNTVIHELTHNLYFAKGQAVFNESFANFVGARGAQWFFESIGDSSKANESVARWADDRVMAVYWAGLYRDVDSTFRANPGDSLREMRIALRDSIYLAARRTLIDSVAPLLTTIDGGYAHRVRLDNAALMARRIYLTDLEAFEVLYDSARGDLRAVIDTVVTRHRSGRFD